MAHSRTLISGLSASVIAMAFLFATLFFPHLASAQEQGGWRDQSGHPAPPSDFRKSSQGFGGWVIVTPDQDWQAKWNTPAETAPKFAEAHAVPLGKQVFVLIFFANPKLNSAGEADVGCDFAVIRPDGTTSMHQENAVCFKGAVKGNPRYTFLSAPVIGISGDPGDPLGEWTVRATLHDNVRGAELSLRTTFVLTDK